jgi:outer membrane protein OmpA-like peptidoglycan-associated protein
MLPNDATLGGKVAFKRGATMIRSIMPILFSLAILISEASAQDVGIDPYSYRPGLHMPLSGNAKADTYRRLPYRDLGSEIHIQVTADALYDFDNGKVRSSAADYFQQAANLIFEEARGQVRIECQSDRDPPQIGQKLAEQCANAIARWMTVEENLTKVKFTAVGKRLSAVAQSTNNIFPPKTSAQPSVTIVFTKK